jgi:hypothetical protein
MPPIHPICLPGVHTVSFITFAFNCGNTVAPSSVSVSNATRLYTIYITKEQLFPLLHEIWPQYNFKNKMMHLTTTCYEINFLCYYHNVTNDPQSVTNFLVSASTNVITSAMQYLTLFSLDEGGSRFLQNICSSVPDYTNAISIPLYQTTPLSHLSLFTRLHCYGYLSLCTRPHCCHMSLCTRLHNCHICPSVPDYLTITPIPLYQTTPLSYTKTWNVNKA